MSRIKMPSPRWIYSLGLLFLMALLFLEWQQNPDPYNDYFRQDPGLLNSFYYLSVCVIFGVHGLFAFKWVSKKQPSRKDRTWLWLGFIAIAVLYISSWHSVLSPNGDNAEYIINAKSLVDRGGVYRLDTPAETPNSLASIGLPLLLAPVYAIWGLNFVPMNLLILTVCLACGPLLFIFFRQDHHFYLSALLAMVAFSSPYLLANATTIMTEGPYLFWSLGALIVVRKYADDLKMNWSRYLFMFFLLGWVYLTRAVGVALILASGLYLASRISWQKILGRNSFRDLDQTDLRKFLWMIIPVVVGLALWQFRQQATGVSQFHILFKTDLISQVTDNFSALKNVLGQLIFSPSSFRWYKQSASFELAPFNLFWVLILCIILTGWVYDLARRRLISFYTFTLVLILLIASLSPQERVFMRYLSILIPFFIYHIFSALQLIGLVFRYYKIKHVDQLVSTFSVFLLGGILVLNLSANRYNVLTKGAVFNSWYESFLTAAQWCGENLPDDAYVMSVKPRIVYLYSGCHGLPMVGERDIYTPEYERNKLEEIKIKGVTHMIIDAISRASMANIHPIIQRNPDKFEKLAVPGLNDKCTVVKVRKF